MMNRTLASLVGACALLEAAPALAQSMVLAIVDAPAVADAPVKRVKKVAEEVLRDRGAWRVAAGPEWKKGSPRRACAQADLGCQREVASGTGAAGVVLLWLKSSQAGLVIDAALWVDGERFGEPRAAVVPLESLEMGLTPLLEGLLPAWARKGWGGLKLPEGSNGATVKVDGRSLPTTAGVLALTAGSHQVDLVWGDGRAVLQRLDVAEGSRTQVELPVANAALASGLQREGGNEKLRAASFGLWVAGSATIAASFIVGFTGRQTAVGANPCRPDSRECLTLQQATERNQQAQGYARSATALLWVGIGLALAGAGLFAWDVVF